MYPKLTSRNDILAMLDEMTRSREKILTACEGLNQDQLTDPVYPGTWNLLKNLAHLAFAEDFMMAWIQCRPNFLEKESYPVEPAHQLGDIRTALDEAHAGAIAFLKAHPESVLTEKCVFGRNQAEQTVGGLYFHIIEHEISHRSFILHKLGKVQAKSG